MQLFMQYFVPLVGHEHLQSAGLSVLLLSIALLFNL